MDNSWDNLEPAPLEYFHGRLMDLFHEWRRSRTNEYEIMMTGMDLCNLIAKAKLETYSKYKKLEIDKPVAKNKL